MREHFEDLLDRKGDYWKMIPTNERLVYSVDKEISDKEDVKIITVSKHHKNWKQIFEYPNIEELNLDQPSQEQIQLISELNSIKRLRITSFRIKDIEFMKNFVNLEELALEYVSGFTDLSPLQHLAKLKCLHLENLRSISDFEGLSGIKKLKFLHIEGTLDWKQPINNFSFLAGLPDLEFFSLGLINCKSDFPAFLPVLELRKLQYIRIGMATLETPEFAFLETALPSVKKGFHKGFSWPLYTNIDYTDQGYVTLLGKGQGRVKVNKPGASAKLEAFVKQYEEYKQAAIEIISNYHKD
ncbi:leucine-rich repeat domain-containing protein [Chryseobacterium sp. MEBOG06]|uniref:leucine-rich repeat domain-containing protein n=1 Tax=Chryseobacterium sp. MEBOG06 TaxID=2879938 RepID=UPI001F46D047|nr:leucine-rich repeat domain-containing protein [Chryseobacterium sp. MEBOG06]UKB85935.1 leucine-rich repeat domain-containing protein [Chryseobacterium sp. MEBOG06]